MFRALHENFILPDSVKHSSLLHEDMKYFLKNLIRADILPTELVLKFQGFLNLISLIFWMFENFNHFSLQKVKSDWLNLDQIVKIFFQPQKKVVFFWKNGTHQPFL